MSGIKRLFGFGSKNTIALGDGKNSQPKEGIKNRALRLMGDLKNWAKEKLYKSPVGGLISRHSLGRAKKAVKLHTTAVELFKEMHSNIESLATGIAEKPPYQLQALGIVRTQLEQATKNKAKAEAAVRSSREEAKLVTSSPKHDAALKKFDESMQRLNNANISRKDLSRMADQFKTNITKKFTPGIFTRDESKRKHMSDVQDVLLQSVDDSTADLVKLKETKKERKARNEKIFEKNAGEGNLNMKRIASESDINKLKMKRSGSESYIRKDMLKSLDESTTELKPLKETKTKRAEGEEKLDKKQDLEDRGFRKDMEDSDSDDGIIWITARPREDN